MKDRSFKTLPIKRKSISADTRSGYRIYSDAKNFTVVQAETAKEAIEKSGVAHPYKVARQETIAKTIYEDGLLVEPVEKVPEVPAEVAAAEIVPEEATSTNS